MDALTDEQRACLRLSLVALERELERVHEASADGAAPVELDQPIGRISRMDAIQQQRMLQANRAAMQRRLQLARAALRRFDEDEYGGCVACGEDVGFRRLEAQPEAPLCIACQSRSEQRG
ncbi:MAG: TraR/DksA family transcriptional regulator [Deltaproteobacteria bacterium]|nr:TraR/DksA family transcriptional regulator [Deltaproteobacteria bacterium]MBW2361363.1 TraR/DksA family transcriptional regulator [Deltaproteobacteria bacterium]